MNDKVSSEHVAILQGWTKQNLAATCFGHIYKVINVKKK
jgi:hypothetical protein